MTSTTFFLICAVCYNDPTHHALFFRRDDSGVVMLHMVRYYNGSELEVQIKNVNHLSSIDNSIFIDRAATDIS
jgi:hypothetical protein